MFRSNQSKRKRFVRKEGNKVRCKRPHRLQEPTVNISRSLQLHTRMEDKIVGLSTSRMMAAG